jgi:2,4-dienoyl-CoA reductase-like NADH-dependent reductase (Old Yellow Enzyme family)
MAIFEKFNIKSFKSLKNKIAKLGLDLPVSENFDILKRPVTIGKLTAPNSLAIHPMEGFDSEPSGGPGELTARRYTRYAAGGAGLLWFEACSVMHEGRSNPRQLHINKKNVADYAILVKKVRRAAKDAIGNKQRPVLILQLTVSGRYSNPDGTPRPIIAHHSPILDPLYNLPSSYPLITDNELDELQQSYVKAALLAEKAGFDGVDIKSCHRYLVSELLASFTRENSRYGGSFENRTRFLTETIAKVKEAAPGLEVTTRMNVSDMIPYPYGFGMSALDPAAADLCEPKQLAGKLSSLGVNLISISIGNPYYQPHYGRPYDKPIVGGYVPQEHPLQSVERMIAYAREIQMAHPSLAVVGAGYSWLRQFVPFVAAGVLDKGWARIIGLGRSAFAYPDFARDIFSAGGMDPHKCCITCSACTQLMRDSGRAGCVPRDSEIYGPIYREYCLHESTVKLEKAHTAMRGIKVRNR